VAESLKAPIHIVYGDGSASAGAMQAQDSQLQGLRGSKQMAETISALVEMERKLQYQLDDATDKSDEARMATY
jgi:hypothetical protein